MSKAFFAILSRLKLINRWSLMRNTSQENVMEHSFQVACLAHALVLIRKQYFSDFLPRPDLETVLVKALYHDASEIMTGDLPTPIKYSSQELREAFKKQEEKAVSRLIDMLPPELRSEYTRALVEEESYEQKIVKAADRLSAYVKCLEECHRGNQEFQIAMRQTRDKLDLMSQDMPELGLFMRDFLPYFQMSIDELQEEG